MSYSTRRAFATLFSTLILCGLAAIAHAEAHTFRAGAAAVDITPPAFPVRVNGMFTERSADAATDPLYARAMALDDGSTRLLFCIVDTCMMEQELIDTAKAAAAEKTGVPVDRMMVSATHTHSAPSAMACLGSRQDPDYAAWLPGRITEALIAAAEALQPARIGWASVDDWAHTHNRRWIRRADKTFEDPFGVLNVRAHMHPGYESPDIIGPSGPVDPGLSVIAAKTPDGTPIAFLANYSQHYYSSPLLSADYFGSFARAIARHLGQPSSEGPFVAMMSQGTSGDLMWMDYGSPQKDGTHEQYAEEVAARALEAWDAIEWHDHAPLGMAERVINLAWRAPDADRLAWARERVAALGGEIPKTQPDIYAHEAIHLHERQRTDLKLQAIRIGDLTIATLPNEVYAITGLKLKRQAPLAMHFNIELANGSVGYIPPPEQHDLGGYTTWPARTAGLEIQAEPTIVETLLGAMEDVTGAPRKPLVDSESAYSEAVTRLAPASYWRLNEIQGRTAHNTVPGAPDARLSGGAALYLPGPGSGTGWGAGEQLRASNFSGPGEINRAVHFVKDGVLAADLPELRAPFTLALWFWLGESSGGSIRDGALATLPSGDQLRYTVDASGSAGIFLVRAGDPAARYGGRNRMPIGGWHLAVLVGNGSDLYGYIDGNQTEPEATRVDAEPFTGGAWRFAEGLEGKLDEIALFDRALSAEERRALWDASGIEAARAQEAAERERAEQALTASVGPPTFPAGYADAIAALKPRLHAPLDAPQSGLAAESGVRFHGAAFAGFQGGRLHGNTASLGDAYSVSLWFKNTVPNDARAVTAYLFSLGQQTNESLTGDHLGIGGTHRAELAGRLILFNGNDKNEVAAGTTPIAPGTWNHVLFVRSGNRVSAWLNGAKEIDTEIATTATDTDTFYLGARNDFFAPLSGHLAHFTLFDRALTEEEAVAIHTASGQPVGSPPATPVAAPVLTSNPLDPKEGLASIRVPEGYTVDLVACEPNVIDPVAFDWDTRGRLWVVEMSDYPLGLDGNGAPGGRVRVLEDRDRDGFYETSQLFADGLNFPTGILTWRDGAIVTAAPDILFLRDATGDGVADEREVLITGLSEGNQQLRANGLRWGLDDWVYVAAGGHHGDYGADTVLRSTRANTETLVGSRDFRFKPDTGELEPQSGPTQFGRNRDDWGRWFGTQNARPLWHYALPDHYLKRNPYFAAPDGQVQVLGEVGPPVYPTAPLEKRYHDFKSSGHFTSACSGMIYRDVKLFPPDNLNGFTCEPFHNLVQRIELEHDGVTFRGKRAGAEDEPDFFASNDRWCRPVMVRTGPDGGLWIADMYRYMIEHPQWLPEEGRAELLPHYREGDDKGRIYRVRRTDEPIVPVMDFSETPTAELAGFLSTSNGWYRDKAQQLILWRGDTSAAPGFAKYARNGHARGRLHMLWTLEGLGALTDDLVAEALQAEEPGLRENALRLAETHASESVVAAALAVASDPDPKVRQQLAFSIGSFPATPEAGHALADLLLQHHDDPFITAAALSSALPHQETLIAALANRNDPAMAGLRPALAEIGLGTGNAPALAALLQPAFQAALEAPSLANAEAAAAMLDLLDRRDFDLKRIPEVDTRVHALLAAARLALQGSGAFVSPDANESETETARIAAATLLARVPADQGAVFDAMSPMIKGLTPPEPLQQALATLARTSDERVPGILFGAWSGLAPGARESAAGILLSRPAWTRQLIEALGGPGLRATDLSPIRRTQLANHPDQDLRALAAARLESAGSPARAGVVAAYAPALALEGDPARGLPKFNELCAQCHKHGEIGLEIGPDVRTFAQHPKEKLLANILDPNLDIQPGYHAYNCETEDGELLFGLIASENATSITMKVPGGQLRTVLRSDIYKLSGTSLSMMPEGLEAALTHQEMADLIAFIKK